MRAPPTTLAMPSASSGTARKPSSILKRPWRSNPIISKRTIIWGSPWRKRAGSPKQGASVRRPCGPIQTTPPRGKTWIGCRRCCRQGVEPMSLANPLSTAQPDRRRGWWLAGLLVLVAVTAYLPMLRNGFVWDDDSFLTNNALIKAPDGLFRFWFSTQPSDYWPVTSSTLWIEWRLWGMHAVGYHATNLVLHVLEGLMLWSVLKRLRVPGAYLAALLFVVHPVNVESVAWIAQRKNLMAMLFYLASILFFLRWSALPPTRLVADGVERARWRQRAPPIWYGLSLLAFVLAMLSKGSVAPLPVVFLGIIAWRRRITRQDFLKLAPFFAVAAVLIAVNIWFQTHGSGEVVRQANGLERLLGAAAVVWFYLYKALLPVDLIFVYPQWHIRADEVLWWLPLVASVGFTVVLWRLARLRSPSRSLICRGAFFAWAYFVVMLLPVMGFTDVYFMRYALVADHYQHFAIIGVLAFAAAAWAHWSADSRLKLALAAAVVGVLAVLTWRQCGMYRDTPTLYRVTLQRNPDCWMVHNNLGLLEYAAGKSEMAKQDYDEALRLNPHFCEASLNVANYEFAKGRPQEALADCEQSLRDNPHYPEGYYSLGNTLHSLGRNPEAVTAYQRALQLHPDYPDAENSLGVALADLGQAAAAVVHYQKAIRWDPAYAPAHYNFGNVLLGVGQNDGAIREYEEALRLKPDYPDAENNLAQSLERAGRVPEAIVRCQDTVRFHPNDPAAHNRLGIALAMGGRLAAATEQFQAALQIKPDYADAQQNL